MHPQILLIVIIFLYIPPQFRTSYHRGDSVIDNKELPIGFTMELAQHSDVLNRFAQLPESEQKPIIDGARKVRSHNEMRNYVENMFQ